MADAAQRLAETVTEYRRWDKFSGHAITAAEDMADAAEALLADLSTDTPGGDGV